MAARPRKQCQADKLNHLGFLEFYFFIWLDILLPCLLIERIMMSHGFLRSNKTEVCFGASLVPTAGSFPVVQHQLTQAGEVFLPLILVCAKEGAVW